MERAQKKELVENLNESFKASETVIVVQNHGLSVSQMDELRSRVREAGASFKVAKNRLVKLAIKDTDFKGIEEFLNGPTAVCYSDDAVAPAKVVAKFANDNDKLVVIGGSFGDKVLDRAGVEQLSRMPSLDEIRGKLVGLLQAPAQKLVGVAQAPAGQLARVFSAYGSKDS